MNTSRFLLIAALTIVAVAAPLSAQPRYHERYSTDEQNGLKKVTVNGRIESIDGPRATLRTESGDHVSVNLGPRWYWQQQGYNIREGVDITVSGWGDLYGNDGGFLFAGSLWGPGFSIELWNSDGYPRWADDRDYGDGYNWRPDYNWCDRQWCCDPPRRYVEYRYCPPPPPRHYCWTPAPRWGWDDRHHWRGHDRHRRGCR